jgi:hypothetical protein
MEVSSAALQNTAIGLDPVSPGSLARLYKSVQGLAKPSGCIRKASI